MVVFYLGGHNVWDNGWHDDIFNSCNSHHIWFEILFNELWFGVEFNGLYLVLFT